MRETPSPIFGFNADPNLVVIDGTYWVYTTVDGLDDWSATGFHAFSSTDLVDWRDHGVVFDLAQSGWATHHAWAPGFAQRDGRFFLYYSADENNIGVAVGEAPDGPFVDLGRPLVPAGRYSGRAIDPSVFVDDDGAAYLCWGNQVAHLVVLNDDLVSFEESAVVSWRPEEFCEAAWLHRRDGVYYLSWSVADTRDPAYSVYYATGASPFGPWKHHGLLIGQIPERGVFATGHHSIALIPGTDDWIVAYHRFAIPDGDGTHREIRFDRLAHTADGLIDRVVPSQEPLRVPLSGA